MASRTSRGRGGRDAPSARRTTRVSDTTPSASASARRRTSVRSSPRPNYDDEDDGLIYEGALPLSFDHARVRFVARPPLENEDERMHADEGEEASAADEDEVDDDLDAVSPSPSPVPSHSRSASPLAANGSSSVAQSPSPSPTPRDHDGDEVMVDTPRKPKTIASMMEEPLAPLPRKSVIVPMLGPPRPRVGFEDLPPFRRPALRIHQRPEEQRLVKIQSLINDEQYPEQLIDANSTLVQYGPPPAPNHGLPSLHGIMMSPLLSSRSPLSAPAGATTSGTTGTGGGTSIFQSNHIRQISLGSSPSILRKQSTAGLPVLPPSHMLPGSPVPRGSSGMLVPSTPFQRQSSLTFPLPVPVPVGPKSSIVTQFIPYGRIQILPSSRPIVCASSVPASATSWYLPTSRSSTLYITLDLPGHFDFEIKLENVFVLPDAVDADRLRVQQRMIYEGRLPCKLLPTEQSASPAALKASPSKSRRVGGHLQRKRQTQTELQRLQQMEDTTMEIAEAVAPTDALEAEFQLADASPLFAPPQLRDVQVSIKSAGQSLIPMPPHTIQEPVFGATITAPPQPPKPKPPAKGAAVKPAAAPAAAPSSFCYAPPVAISTTPRFVPQGPSTLSHSRPSLTFAHGSISLERMKPRLGGWVVKRELTMEAARSYTPVEATKPVAKPEAEKKEPLVKLENEPTSGTPSSYGEEKRVFIGYAPMTAPPSNGEASSEPANEPNWQQSFASKNTSVDRQQQDIGEVGDVIRIVIHTPTPPLQAKSKVIKPMSYELVIEGIRVAPYASEPPFPSPLDSYRLGTAPKDAVEADALSTRLTSSVLPSTRLIGANQRHWSDMGRKASRREPLLFPYTFFPSSDESSSEDENDPERPLPNATAVAAAARRRYFGTFPQRNFEEYFEASQMPNETVDEENDFLQQSDESEEEEIEEYTTSESEGASGSDHGSSGSEDYDSDDGGTLRKRKDPPGSGSGRPKGNAALAHRTMPSLNAPARQTNTVWGAKQLPTKPALGRPPSTGSSKVPKGSQSSRAPLPSSSYVEVEAPIDSVWAACDKCGKWRKMPAGTREEELPSVWYCIMNPDPHHNLCKHPEETDQDAMTGSYAANAPSAASSSASTKGKPSKESTPTPHTPEKAAEKATPAATAAAQAQHTTLLFPCPRLPTADDVCDECEKALVAPDDTPAKLSDTLFTVFCHGPCARTWHRDCASIKPSGFDIPLSTAAPSSDSSSAPVSSSSSTVPTVHPSTHVTPFTPLTKPYFYCADCMTLTNSCFACYKRGTIDPTKQRIFDEKTRRWDKNPQLLTQCPYTAGTGCGRFYHEKCLFDMPRTMTHKGSRTGAGRDSVTLTPNLVPRLRAPLICALHQCASCNGAGTTSTNVRDVGRTLVHCIKCSEAYHWSSKCRHEDSFTTVTKKYGICDGHGTGSGSDAEDEELRERRNANRRDLTLTYDKAPLHLFGAEPTVEPSDSSDDESRSGSEEDDGDSDASSGSDHSDDSPRRGGPHGVARKAVKKQAYDEAFEQPTPKRQKTA